MSLQSFETLEVEYELYNYGEIGHFWVKGLGMPLRLICEYRIAILWDKFEYMGEDCCGGDLEQSLRGSRFPPLNFTSYLVPSQYLSLTGMMDGIWHRRALRLIDLAKHPEISPSCVGVYEKHSAGG